MTILGALAQPSVIVHAQVPDRDVPIYFGELVRPPIDPPIVVNGTFGEHRSGHYHGGLDLATGGQIGRPVYAPLDGWVERVRASGSGYGRSIYLRSDDGRLLVFAHLDHYAEPLAGYVAEQQESKGRYEQDLWPERERFRFKAGDRIAWTGQSGAGPPHLHFEIRGSDTAYNPLLAGFGIPDSLAPDLEHLRLEPLDAGSFATTPKTAARSRIHAAAPLTLRVRDLPDTLVVLGRVRAILTVKDRFGRIGRNAAPWSVVADFAGQSVECRFDHASWAGEMPESDFIYRRAGGQRRGIRLWAPADFRPVVMRTTWADRAAAGVLEVRPGDPPQRLDITARDVTGNRSQLSVVLRPPRRAGHAQTRIPLEASSAGRHVSDASAAVHDSLPAPLTFSTLAGRHLRIGATGARWKRSEPRGVAFDGDSLASAFGPDRLAVLDAGSLPRTTRLRVVGGGTRSPRWNSAGPALRLSAAEGGAEDRFGGLAWDVPFGAVFEPGVFVAESLGVAQPTRELRPIGRMFVLHPSDLPLRKSIHVWLDAPPIDSLDGVGLYRGNGRGWGFSSDDYESVEGRFHTTTRRLGHFALFRDVEAPRIRLRRPRWLGPDLGYSQWQLRAVLDEIGSGVDRHASYFEVNGKRVPTEWDPEAKMLRWRPLKRPPPGRFAYTVVATDRAGNVRRRSSSFVLN